MNQLNLHFCGFPHTITSDDFNACAFTSKIFRIIEAMNKRGHNTTHYGNPGARVKGKHVDVVPESFFNEHYGKHLEDSNKVYEPHEYSEHALTFNMRMCSEIRLRAKPGDLVLINNGIFSREIVHMLTDIQQIIICEMSVGYIRSIHAPFRVYESYSNQEFHKGEWDTRWESHNISNSQLKIDGKDPVDFPMNARHNTEPQFMDDVIPMFFDPRKFEYNPAPGGDYHLFVGRIQWSKGIDLAIQACKAMGETLVVAGQCKTSFEQEMGYEIPDHVDLIGYVDVKERKHLMSKAKAGWVPTYYPEPGGHVMGEFALSGRPVVVTDWGNMPHFVLNGITGYRVRSGHEAELAIKQINQGKIKPNHCRKWAMNFTMDRQARAYEYYFRRLRDFVLNGGHNDLYYDQSDVDLSVRDLIHPKDSEYDIDLKRAEPNTVGKPETELSAHEHFATAATATRKVVK